MNPLIEEYKASLNDKEKVVLEIAEHKLETSFDIVESIGFKKWFKSKKKLSDNSNNE
jgi:hypothetical protein|tara:strand:+ start:4647 stop:4817 length:171 start_codon:yes stop_codon:yes gene_type:complete